MTFVCQSGPSSEEQDRKRAMDEASGAFVAAKEFRMKTPEVEAKKPRDVDWDAVEQEGVTSKPKLTAEQKAALRMKSKERITSVSQMKWSHDKSKEYKTRDEKAQAEAEKEGTVMSVHSAIEKFQQQEDVFEALIHEEVH
jgi:hypothetical protein